MSQYITGIITGISITDIIDIIIMTGVVYALLGYLKSTRAAQLAKGIIIVIAIAFVAELCNLYALSWLISNILNVGAIALIVVFQPELRRALDVIGRRRLGVSKTTISNEASMAVVQAMLDAIEYFSVTKTGAIIIIEQETALNDIAETGTFVDAAITEQAIENIFYKGAPLHDGAVIIRGDRIYTAGCVLPLTQNQNLSKDLGTRHRAALGISEVSDALVIVVSEETGIISTARDGKLSRFLDLKSVEKMLLNIYIKQDNNENTFAARLQAIRRKPNGKQENN